MTAHPIAKNLLALGNDRLGLEARVDATTAPSAYGRLQSASTSDPVTVTATFESLKPKSQTAASDRNQQFNFGCCVSDSVKSPQKELQKNSKKHGGVGSMLMTSKSCRAGKRVNIEINPDRR